MRLRQLTRDGAICDTDLDCYVTQQEMALQVRSQYNNNCYNAVNTTKQLGENILSPLSGQLTGFIERKKNYYIKLVKTCMLHARYNRTISNFFTCRQNIWIIVGES